MILVVVVRLLCHFNMIQSILCTSIVGKARFFDRFLTNFKSGGFPTLTDFNDPFLLEWKYLPEHPILINQ